MNKSLSLAGLVAVSLTSLGMIFKIMHWPGAGILLVLGLSLFALFFLPFYGYNLFYEMHGAKSKIAGIAGGALLSFTALAVLFKVQHWPGSGAMLVLQFGVFAVISLLVLMMIRLKTSSSAKENFLHISYYLSLSFGSLGYLFKIQHWPGAGPLLILGTILLVFGYLPIAYQFYNNEQNIQKLYARFTIIPLALVFVLLMVSNISKGVLNAFVLIENGVQEKTASLETKNNFMFGKFSKVSNEKAEKAMQVKKLADDLNNYIAKLKLHLMRETDQNLQEMSDDSIKFSEFIPKDNYDVPTRILIGDREKPNTGEWSAAELKGKIVAYKEQLLAMCEGENKEMLSKTINLTTADFGIDYNGEFETWEVGLFYHVPMASVITSLSSMQMDVRYAESLIVDNLYYPNSVTSVDTIIAK